MGWAATHTFSVGEVLTAANMNLIQNNINAANPVGKLHYVVSRSGGNATETVWQTGWLECNGAVVSRSTYSALFSYLNGLSPALPFGSGDGSTTFTLPDFQGRMPVHHVLSGGHSDVMTLGNSEGITFDKRRPKHRTTDNLTVTSSLGINDPGHTHVTAQSYRYTSAGASSGSAGDNLVGGSANGVNSNTTGITLSGSQASRGGSIGTNVANDSIDTSPYLVAGIWVIKF